MLEGYTNKVFSNTLKAEMGNRLGGRRNPGKIIRPDELGTLLGDPITLDVNKDLVFPKYVRMIRMQEIMLVFNDVDNVNSSFN